ncbi:hypothetical protein DFH08DRAFT_812154 [Mycena albidolilacea]|uniref:Uncharacterized protein n=1 Tax=Mycena albidolilacea TaxID=1033008 RepID=A0AAD7ENK7_9AGAR|nr:hypothetical protein DFH08DRAFT_812154 [Mycena albidolilacea]
MPLFGSSHNENKLTKPNHTTELNSTGAGAGLGRTDEAYPATGTGMTNEPGIGNNTVGGGRHHVPGETHPHGMMADQQYGTAGVGAGAGSTAIPPASNLHHSGGGGSSTTGKIERTVGNIVGSKSLQAKGLQKEEEARGLKIQSQELAEAERLEREAGLRRERAVAHGAHPDTRHVGGLGGGVGGAGTGTGAY